MFKSTLTKLSEDNFNVFGFDEKEEFNTVLKNRPVFSNISIHEHEEDLEKDFISKLKSLGYEYLNIHNPIELYDNLRKQIEKLNAIKFNDYE
ncbi:hypothetical protein IKS57_05100 [bacterium]|nr:hypothetical protein [bacterium]